MTAMDAVYFDAVSTHSRAEAAAVSEGGIFTKVYWFQHTAARRRLLPISLFLFIFQCFNTQPRGGGCL